MVMMTPNTLDRSRKRKLKLLNLVKRGRIFYFKKRSGGQLFFESLHTDDETLAAEKAKVKTQQLVAGELAKLREEKKAATLAHIIAVHQPPPLPDGRKVRMPRSLHCQCQSAWLMVRATRGKDLQPDQISLTEFTPKLVRDFQDAMRQRYVSELMGAKPQATADEVANVSDRADRSSKSLFNQAKNLFCRKHSRIERYREKGLIIPKCVEEFRLSKALGSMTSKAYLPPDDTALTQTFTDIACEQECHSVIAKVFWATIAFGGRKNEVMDMQADDFAELDGELWIRGGRGKDKLEIQLPVLNGPVHPANPTVPSDAIRQMIADARAAGRTYLFAGSSHYRQDILPRLMNSWLLERGWRDAKKMHALRAYVGSLLYSKDPHLAKDYLRHKNLQTTENFYSHFFRLKKITRLQVVERVTAPPATNALTT